MNSKKILIPAIILVAAVAIIVIVNQLSNRGQGGEPAAFFPGASEKNIGSVLLTDAQDQVKILRKGNAWVVVPKAASAPGAAASAAAGFPVDSGAISQLFENIVKVKKAILVSENPAKQETFEVDGAHGKRIEVFAAGGKSLGIVVMGKEGADNGSSYFRSEKSNSVYLVPDINRFAFSADHKRWADRNILKIEKTAVKQISIVKGGAPALIIARSADSAVKGWELASPAKKPVDSNKVDAFLGGLAGMQAADYEDSAYTDSATGLANPEVMVTVTLKSGATHTLAIGNQKPWQSRYWLKNADKPYVFLIEDAQYKQFDKRPEDFQSLPPKPEKPAAPAMNGAIPKAAVKK